MIHFQKELVAGLKENALGLKVVEGLELVMIFLTLSAEGWIPRVSSQLQLQNFLLQLLYCC